MRTRYCLSAIIADILKIVAASNASEDADSWSAPTELAGMEDGAAAYKVKYQMAQRSHS